MSRKFNTKKFIKDVLNDKYALVVGNEIILDTKEPTEHQRTAMQSVAEVLLCSSFSAPLVFLLSPFGDSEMARNGFKDGSKRCASNSVELS